MPILLPRSKDFNWSTEYIPMDSSLVNQVEYVLIYNAVWTGIIFSLISINNLKNKLQIVPKSLRRKVGY